MDDSQGQDQYEERLKEVFDSFDSSGSGSLSAEELSLLCQSLHLDDATPALLHRLLQDQDRLTARVDFDQFKVALILVLSSNIEPAPADPEPVTTAESPEIQPKFVKGSKRYGRRSTPEFIEPVPEPAQLRNPFEAEQNDKEREPEDTYDSAIPRKRERWNAHDASPDEYEAEGQMHLWNPDEPSTPRGSSAPLSALLEERLRGACEDLSIAWDGCAGHSELMALCEHLGTELNVDVLQSLNGDGEINVQEFVSRVFNHNKPPTPSASTPYRQLKRHHSTQPFDEGGRRIATPSALCCSIGMRLFSTLDDGTGFSPAELILDAWMEEGIENSTEILQALNFSIDGKLSLSDLTMALENELVVAKNGIHQAALASFRSEIRHLLERVDRELQEKEKIRSDLEKAEKLKNQLATEVDEHHSAIEHTNHLNIRKLEQAHKERLAVVRSELMDEMEQIQNQAALQREELEAEVEKIREDETFLRDHLSISVKENRRLEMELLDSTDKLEEAQVQVTKLQTSLDNVMKEKFGDLDPSSADFLLQEERIKQLRNGYEVQYRELQDRIDELQSELQEYHSLGRVHLPCHKPLSEELESKSPGMESDPGIGSDEVQPFSMSLEAEMMLEQLKEQHLQEMEDLRNQLESKIKEFDEMVETQRALHDDERSSLSSQHRQEVQALMQEMSDVQIHTQMLQSRLDEAEGERGALERAQADERAQLESLQDEEVGNLRQQLLEARTWTLDLEEQLKTLETQQTEAEENLEELRTQHADEIKKLEEEHAKVSEAALEEEKEKLSQEKSELEQRLSEDIEKEKELLQKSHEEELQARLEEAQVKFEGEREEIVQRLTEQWQKEKAQLDEQHNESLQVLLEEEMLKLVREQEEKEAKLREEWEAERAQIEQDMAEKALQEKQALQEQFEQREKKLREEWERERLQLEEDYEGMVQDRMTEEREKAEAEREEEEEKRLECLIAEERVRLEESHRQVMSELTVRHAEERDALSSTLDKLREEIAQERREIEMSFSQRLKEVEERFSDEQESVAKRFQADVLKLEEHYQSELKVLSESHNEQKLQWEAQLQEALESAEEQRRTMEEANGQEKLNLSEEWERERQELERLHREKMAALVAENQQLQNELAECLSASQNKEIELSRQLNELHTRLQESLENKDQILSQFEKRALETELLLNQTVDDFTQERAEFTSIQSELEAKCGDMVSSSERQTAERIQLLTERDDLRVKIEELEMLLKQAAVDFELERMELQEQISVLEDKLKDTVASDGEELVAETEKLKVKIEELEMELRQVLSSEGKEEDIDEAIETLEEECIPDQEQETHLAPPEICLNDDVMNADSSNQEQDGDVEIIKEATDEEDGGPENIDTENNENVTASVDQVEEIKENEEHDGQILTVDDNDACPDSDTCPNEATVLPEDCQFGVSSCDEGERDPEVSCCSAEYHESTPCDGHKLDSTVEEEKNSENKEARTEKQSEPVSPLEALDGGENREALESGDPEDLSLADAEVTNNSQDFQPEDDLLSDLEDDHLTAEVKEDSNEGATVENALLHEKISLLQQKTEILESLLAHNSEKVKTGQNVLEENYSLKVQMLFLMDHVKELEIKVLKMTDLQIRYEDCLCENVKLKDQNTELETTIWSLESKVNVFRDYQDEEVSLEDEIVRMREENAELSGLFRELERQSDILSAVDQDGVSVQSEGCAGEPGPDGGEPDLEGCCQEFEKRNTDLRRAITELQDKSQSINDSTQVHRSETSRLAEENLILKKNIAALKEKDLKEAQEELVQTLAHLKKGKIAAKKAAGNFKKQISELRLQSRHLEDDNGTLSETNTQNIAAIEHLQQQLAELIKETERKEAWPEEKHKMASCVSALETELNRALEDTAQLEERNKHLCQQLSELREKVDRVDSLESQIVHLVEDRTSVEKETSEICNQLAKAQERVKAADETLQVFNHQSARLTSDLCVLQQEKDSLQHEVNVLHKQLQNVNDKNHVLERALHSTGLKHQSKKLYRDELSRLKEQDHSLLRQENERLQAEVLLVKGDLVQSREKVRQLDASVLSLKQHKQPGHSSLLKALEQENQSLKKELQAHKELAKGRDAGQGHAELEGLQQENEALRTQMARLSTQLLEAFQAQLVGLLPPSPHRMPRGGQHRADDQDNMQDERERKMKGMEERMREIEQSLRNVKLLLREKVLQLKDQMHRSGKADVLIQDLYEENGQLLKALEVTEQRHKITEKKNYLLEEKISSLNKIVRELNPALPFHYTGS